MHSLSYNNLSLALNNLGEHDIEENSGDEHSTLLLAKDFQMHFVI